MTAPVVIRDFSPLRRGRRRWARLRRWAWRGLYLTVATAVLWAIVLGVQLWL